MLIVNTLFGEVDKVKQSIELLRQYEPKEGYCLAFSGGKDSVTLKALADMAGVKYDAHYNLTTVDPPELVRFVKTFKDVDISYPNKSMWQLIVENLMPPTRLARYCCEELKERGGQGETLLTGIRWEESTKRKKRKQVEVNWRDKAQQIINPIIIWTEADIWEFIERHEIKYCSLYDDPGYSRLGCIGCPQKSAEAREFDFNRYPKYRQAYLNTFAKLLQVREQKGLTTTWQTPEDVMRWWIYGKHESRDGGLFDGIK